ncbi:type I methionyl aminopeptidase [Spirochaetota bacterium]
MNIIKNPYNIKKIKEASYVLVSCFSALRKKMKAGITTREIDTFIHNYITKNGAEPSFREIGGYRYASCISVNNEAVHGLPSDRALQDGDVLTIDIGVKKSKYYSDAAWTYAIGDIDDHKTKMIKACYSALLAGIKELCPGNDISKVGKRIESVVKKSGFHVLKEFTGHGVGFNHHEEPHVLNFYSKGIDAKIQKGMVIAVEPVITDSKDNAQLSSNGWTYTVKEGSIAVQFEHTVYVSDNGPVILTYWEM